MFLAVIIAFIINMFKSLISKFVRTKIEDSLKLSDDYNKIIKQYPCEKNFVKYDNLGVNISSIHKSAIKMVQLHFQ